MQISRFTVDHWCLTNVIQTQCAHSTLSPKLSLNEYESEYSIQSNTVYSLQASKLTALIKDLGEVISVISFTLVA